MPVGARRAGRPAGGVAGRPSGSKDHGPAFHGFILGATMFGSVGAVVRNPARWGPYPAAQSLMTRADERRRELLKEYGINSRLLRALAGMSMPTLRHALEQLGPAFDGDKGFGWVEEAGYFGGGRTDGWLTARKGSGGLKLQRLLGSDECRALLRQMVLSPPQLRFTSAALRVAARDHENEAPGRDPPVAGRAADDVQVFLGGDRQAAAEAPHLRVERCADARPLRVLLPGAQ